MGKKYHSACLQKIDLSSEPTAAQPQKPGILKFAPLFLVDF
jgi:hypothetical protein